MSQSKIAISVRGLSKSYTIMHGEEKHTTLAERIVARVKNPLHRPRIETFSALSDVSFDIKRGDVVGIIGRNGAGKSTLLKILSRITGPSKGEVRLYGRVGSLLEVGTGFHPELSGRENIYLNGAILGMSKKEITKQFDAIVDFSEIEKFLDTPVKRYSSGMYVRLAFAVAAHLNPEILIVDEVLAVGDAEFQKKCLGKMKEVSEGQGRTVLFVSHNMAAISHLCGTAIVLRSGKVAFAGSADAGVVEYFSQVKLGTSTACETEPHVLYSNESEEAHTAFKITRISMFQPDGAPLPAVGTFDDVVFRVSFYSERAIARGSVILTVTTPAGARLLLLSTQPDGNLPLSFVPGAQEVECLIRRLPLSAGEYQLGAGLAIPGSEWLYQDERLASLGVKARDCYGSGMVPSASRCFMAVDHEWRRL
jgi:lipopolysaccharide transport system ATP-binding protein